MYTYCLKSQFFINSFCRVLLLCVQSNFATFKFAKEKGLLKLRHFDRYVRMHYLNFIWLWLEICKIRIVRPLLKKRMLKPSQASNSGLLDSCALYSTRTHPVFRDIILYVHLSSENPKILHKALVYYSKNNIRLHTLHWMKSRGTRAE